MPYYPMNDGETLFVRRFGQGQPVLVLSGLGMLSWQWLVFLYPFKHQFEFIIPEWRGFGASEKCKIPNQLNAIESHWNDVSFLIQQLKIQNPIVIAYSMGATTAMHGMQYGEFGQHIKAYLHIDQTPQIASNTDWPFGLMGTQYPQFHSVIQALSDFLSQYTHYEYLSDLPKSAQKTLSKLWLDFIQLQNTKPIYLKILSSALQNSWLQKKLLPSQRIDYMLWYLNTYLNHKEDYRNAVTRLNIPVHYFSGKNSKLYPIEGQKHIAKNTANAKHIIFEKSGHAPLLSEPVKFKQQIQAFLLSHL